MVTQEMAANVLIVGSAAGALKISQEMLDTIGAGGHVTRTVLRSEALRIVRDEPVDLVLAASPASLFATPEFLAVFAGRERPVSLVVLAHAPDAAASERLRCVGVETEHLPPAAGLELLRARVQQALAARARRPLSANRRPPAVEALPPPPDYLFASYPQRQEKDSSTMNIEKTLEEAMKIDGAIGVAVADWDSGLCLGTAGGGARINIEVAAAGNCQVVKAKMATMAELGIKGSIQDILITLDDQIHLLRPVRGGDSLFIYIAIDKAKGNLGMARHRLQKLETELDI